MRSAAVLQQLPKTWSALDSNAPSFNPARSKFLIEHGPRLFRFFYLGWVVLVLLLIVDGLVEVVPQLPGVGPVGFHVARQEILKNRRHDMTMVN